jgi:dTMP kinase
MGKGLIVFFDGPDGVGKTTQFELAAKALRDAGHVVHETRALGGSPIGEKLREAVLTDIERPVQVDFYIALACLHAAIPDWLARREAGETVLVDRSPLSIIAYQVYGDGLDKAVGYQAVGEFISQIEPDVVLVYQAPTDLLHERLNQRNAGTPRDYFESKPAAYHDQVAEGYSQADIFGGRFIDATQPIATVHSETMLHIKTALS